MKNFLKTSLGYPGLALYFVLATLIRIPVGIFLWLAMTILLVIAPIRNGADAPRWVNRIYDWYCGS